MPKHFLRSETKSHIVIHFKDLVYRGQPIKKDNWEKVSAKIQRDFTNLEIQLLQDYFKTQGPIINHVFHAIKQAQLEHEGPAQLHNFWKDNIRPIDIDIRKIDSWTDVVDLGTNSFYKTF